MEKKALLAIGLSCLILVLWQLLFAPKPPPPPVVPAEGSAAGTGVGPSAQEKSGEASPASKGSAAASPEVLGQAAAPKREAPEGLPSVVVETDLARIEFSNPGGRLVSWSLKKYLDHSGKPYELVSPEGPRAGVCPLSFQLEDKVIEGVLNSKARFDFERRTVPGGDVSGSSGAEEIRLIYSDGQGLLATKSFVFSKDSYLAKFSASVSRNGTEVAGRVLWGPGIGTPTAEDLANRYYRGGTAVADFGFGPKRYYASGVAAPAKLEGGLHWVGLEEPYFAAVFITPDGMAGAQVLPIVVAEPPQVVPAGGAPKNGERLVTHLAVGVPTDRVYTLFVGPKDYQLLLNLHRGLADLVNFEPSIPLIGPLVGILAKVLYVALRWLHSFIGNYGLGIVLLTTVIKIGFYPITQRTMVKMRGVQQKMQTLQPKIKAIREKYKKAKDAAGRAKMNEEIMALYKREGVNPMASLGGCLPLLLQLPILYGFYSVLTVSIELRQAPFFGWIADLSSRDPYYITPLLMGASMFAQQKMAMTNVADPQQRAQQRMMLVMPIIFTYTFLSLPSGLVLYWFVNNILGIVQQVLINRQARAIGAEGAAAAGRA